MTSCRTPSNCQEGSGSINRVFDVLRHQSRRRVLDALLGQPPDKRKVKLDKLHDETTDSVPLKIELVHNHLPKLAESDYIEWDRENNVIRDGPKFDEITPVIRLMEQNSDALPGGWP